MSTCEEEVVAQGITGRLVDTPRDVPDEFFDLSNILDKFPGEFIFIA